MNINEILKKINIQATEQEIRDFIKRSESRINKFFTDEWNIFKQELFAEQVKGKQIQLPNVKKGNEYAVRFTKDSIGLPDVKSFEFDKLPEGISYSAEESLISGIPTVAGDHKIILRCVSKQEHKAEKELLLIVVPDPKELWKNIPTPDSIEYFKPDSNCELLNVAVKNPAAQKTMVAASQRGRSHAQEGKPRDDDFALHFDEENECYIMVVADGAGSAKYSRKGSQIACETVMNYCKEKLSAQQENFLKYNQTENKNETGKILQDIIGNAVFEAYKTIEREAQNKSNNIKDYATTLILSLCKKMKNGWLVAAWWVGDGGIGVYCKNPEHLKILGEPDGGEFAGQTRFLTMSEIVKNEVWKRIKFDFVEDFTAIILMTDGVTDPKFETDANLDRIEKWNELWEDLNGNNEDGVKVDLSRENKQTAEQLLKWLDFWSIGNHDDRTIAILF